MESDNYLERLIKVIISVVLLFAQIFIVFVLTTRWDTSSIISVVARFIGILTVLTIIYKDEKSVFKISWIVFILIAPMAGVPVYFLLGRTFLPKRIAAMKTIDQDPYYTLPQNTRVYDKIKQDDTKRLADLAYRLGKFPVYQNTASTYFKIGEEMFARLLIDIKQAKKFVFLEYYIVSEGYMFRELLDALIVKAQEGLEIVFLYDAMGSFVSLPKHFKRNMEKYKIKVYPFNGLQSSVYNFVSFRDHRKITIIDGNIGYCGGINIGDEYINCYEKYGHWKDMALRLEGEGVWSLTMMFLRMLRYITKEEKNIDLYRPLEIPKYVNGFVLPYGDGPTNLKNPAENIYTKVISTAKKYVYMTTPYLALDSEMVNALVLAAKSGVDVRIMMPHIPDKKIVFALSRSYYGQLIPAGVKVYEYTPGFVHGKTMVSDDVYCIVGSVNLDFRSLSWNYECATLVMDNETVLDVRKDFLNTVAISQQIVYDFTKKEFVMKKFSNAILRLLAPLM